MTPADYLRRATAIALFQARASGAVTAWAAPPRVPHSSAASRRARLLIAIAHDPVGYALRAIPRSLELWAGDRPAPGSDAGPDANALFAAIQLLLLVFALIGIARLSRRGAVAQWSGGHGDGLQAAMVCIAAPSHWMIAPGRIAL